jgi:hypothetical protein
MSAPTSWGSLALRLSARAVLNPRLAVDLISLTWAFRRRDWWSQAPFLPLPDREYLEWRMYTAYGDEQQLPSLEDVIRFARWRRELLEL